MDPNRILAYFKEHIGQEPPALAPPFNRWLNGVLKEAEAGRILLHFYVRPEMTNPVRMLHGGMHAAMMDEVIGMAVATVQDETFFTTVNLSIDYLDKAMLGETVAVEAVIVRKGKNMINVTAEVRSLEGKLLSRGSSNLFNTQIPLKF
jgi:acyl-coenzyme A thioesterase 13